jgi:predicted acyl esterase
MAATDQTLVLSPEAPGLQPRLKLQERFPDIIYRKLTPAPEHPHFNYKGFNPSTQVIQKGHVRSPGRRAFPVEVIFERDITITMRDGIKLYADVFRPTNSESAKVPAILPWSPYGKTGTGELLCSHSDS